MCSTTIRSVSGVPCLAKYTADQCYYRAEVMAIDGDQATLRFVDYGSVDVVPVSR